MKRTVLFICGLLLSLLCQPVGAVGQSKFTPEGKILGGVVSSAGKWPWVTALLQADEPDNYFAQYCAGTLIADTWVLTAAHCATDFNPGEIQVAVGVFDLSSTTATRLSVKQIIVHPGYDTLTFVNDIALLELGQASDVTPLKLYSGESREELSMDLLGQTVTAVGWGEAYSGGSWQFPEQLWEVNLPIVDAGHCNLQYAPPSLSSSQVCAGFSQGKDVCRGDSGGPIVTMVDNQWAHAGLVSYGRACQTAFGCYGVYTRTSTFVDFIRTYVTDAQFTQAATAQPWIYLLL